MIGMSDITHQGCECGRVTGTACHYDGDDYLVVEWMPRHLRASHMAAGYCGSDEAGVYPHNGSVRLRVSCDCYEMLREGEGPWISEPRAHRLDRSAR